ncbi:hypothetical protein AACH06_28925 [Ideonella sp. DXS29W]|uniref:DUF1566 domain-containing protein n=1 Tax=Ideonella lacteola TaxID=2984193 RepID=A0ABU9BYC1_9BURK
MTWVKGRHLPSLGIDAVGCHGPGGSCDPYEGDTSCKASLPVLCLKVDGSPRPNYQVDHTGGGEVDAFYRGWARGHIATTTPVLGTSLGSAAKADALCAASFGPGWRMAEFHDGRYVPGMSTDKFYGNDQHWHSASPWTSGEPTRGGWAFWAYGNVRDDTRLWVRINDQRANCWD